MVGAVGVAGAAAPMELETRIALRDVAGRIDHLAVDVARRRLFVAELGSDSIDVVDLTALKRSDRLAGFAHPQGLGFVASTQTLFVASAGDGTLRALHDNDPVWTTTLGSDADNVRVAGDRVYVGYGEGAIAVIDATRHHKIAEIALPAHPEGFGVDADGKRLLVNLPDAHVIAIADLATNQIVRRISTKGRGENFPLANDAQYLLVAFRNPPQLVAYATDDGAERAAAQVCNDADDVFIDSKRRRAYVSCGDGYLDIFALHEHELERVAHLRTVQGARTSLFEPQLDRLFLAVRATGTEPAAIWVYKPSD